MSKNRVYETGSVRDNNEGKGAYYLIPSLPLDLLAKLFQAGADRYGANNWQKGQPLMASYYDSAMRHLNKLKAGDKSERHDISAIWNLFAYVWTLAEIEAGFLPKELDDRPLPEPQYRKKKAVEVPPVHPNNWTTS